MALTDTRTIITNLDYVPQGELLNASDRVTNIALSKTDTATFKIRTDNPLADLCISLEGYVKVYRDGSLTFYGSLYTAEESVDEQGAYITCSAVSPAFQFQKRFLYPNTIVYTADRAAITATLMGNLNTQFASYYAGPFSGVEDYRAIGETGIDATVLPVSSGSTISYNVGTIKSMADIISELSSGTQGFDWRLVPHENFSGGVVTGSTIAYFTAAQTLGSTKPEAVFEFGTGRNNIKAYTRTVSRDTQANRIYHVGPSGAATIDYSIPSFRRWNAAEDHINTDINDAAAAADLAAQHIYVRKEPRTTISFTPSGDYGDSRLPKFGVDYGIGDVITGRAVSNGSTRFNGLFRVWAVSLAVDNNGIETTTLTLTPE